MTAPTPVAYREVPTLAEVRAWLGLSHESMSDAQLGHVLYSEQGNQWRVCVWEQPVQPLTNVEPAPYLIPEPIAQALLRRCARQVAAKGIPLGLTASDEYGASRLPRSDAEIERLESTYRRIVFA